MSTLADELWFDSLDIEWQTRIRALVNSGYLSGPGSTDAQLLRAYETGWDHAIEEMESCLSGLSPWRSEDHILQELKR
jgi:hypothetical protein